MTSKKPSLLDLGVRVYPETPDNTRGNHRKPWRCPEVMFVIDAETRTDETQRLTFGSYRFYMKGRCVKEALFYADDLPAQDLAVLQRYVETHPADTTNRSRQQLQLLTRGELVERLFNDAYRARCLLVGFNLPFDLSRIARDFGKARGRFTGGFSLDMASYFDASGVEHTNPNRPRICIYHMNSKGARKGFTSRKQPDADDLIPEDSDSGTPQPGYKFAGHFLDLRTLAFALTDRSYTLEAACKAFGVEHGKQKIATHGLVTEEYIDYNRRDVLATAELATKLIPEFQKHPIDLDAAKAYSPASLGKAYLRKMGINPLLERQPDFPKEYLGYAQSTFFGGRTSAHIRKVPVPVVYTDFLSMYPTVNSLMGLWRYVIADEISVVKNCRVEIENFLRKLNYDSLFTPQTWRSLTAFVKIIPNGEILPTRATYSQSSNDYQVAVNHIYASDTQANQALWFTLPDVAASVILTGRIPQVVDAFRIEPRGVIADLKATKLYGEVEVNPAADDFFRHVIEQRKLTATRTDLTTEDKGRLDKALKVLANSASYGIYAEMNRQEASKKVEVTCFGIDADPFVTRIGHPDVPGEYCFPPLASLITGAARLMLAMLERAVADLGGTYAMEDTDSMAIVATKRGGFLQCPGGLVHNERGQAGIKALSWRQLAEVAERFASLNPYDRTIIPGSILKIEDENFDLKTGMQRQLYCLAISAKRYTLFTLDKDGEPAMLRQDVNNKVDRWSEHGLGHLLNPTDPESSDRDWIGQIWLNLIRESLHLKTSPLPFESLPAVGRVSVSSPAVMRAFDNFNDGKSYSDRIKPFNFILTCQVKPLGHPTGADPKRFHLILPYNPDSRAWLKTEWIDQYSGEPFRIATHGHHGGSKIARVKTYGDTILEYAFHPEAKCDDSVGNFCGKQTVGLLSRRHVQVDRIRFIGKESNSLEAVEAGMIHAASGVYAEYEDASRDAWSTKTLPILKTMPLSLLVGETGLSRRALLDLRAGRSRPHRRNLERIATVALNATRS